MRGDLLRLQRQLAAYKLLIIDELAYVPLSTTGAELLFEGFSQRYERGSIILTSNLPFDVDRRVWARLAPCGAFPRSSLSEPRAGTQPCQREPLFMPQTRHSTAASQSSKLPRKAPPSSRTAVASGWVRA